MTSSRAHSPEMHQFLKGKVAARTRRQGHSRNSARASFKAKHFAKQKLTLWMPVRGQSKNGQIVRTLSGLSSRSKAYLVDAKTRWKWHLPKCAYIYWSLIVPRESSPCGRKGKVEVAPSKVCVHPREMYLHVVIKHGL